MNDILAEFLRLLFQPPALILFCLAVVGLSTLLSDRNDRKFFAAMNWRSRESMWRQLGFSEDMIAALKKKYYAERGLKLK